MAKCSESLRLICSVLWGISRVFPDLHNDVGLIRVNGKIEFSDKVTPLNLPPYDFDVDTDGQGFRGVLLSFAAAV